MTQRAERERYVRYSRGFIDYCLITPQAAAAATGGKLTRAPACDPFAGAPGHPHHPRGDGPGGGMGRHSAAAAARANGGGPPRGIAAPPRSRRGAATGEAPLPPRDIGGVNKDCFIIPQGNLERFLPDGITVSVGRGGGGGGGGSRKAISQLK